MTIRIDRRSFLLTGSFGLGALAVPGFGWAQTVAALRGFTHSVASGEPGAHSMLLWTRYVPDAAGGIKLKAEVSRTADFARVVAGGEIVTGPWRDYTAKVTVTGLEPGTRYFYRFVAPDGSASPVGRTRTLPVGLAKRFGIGVFSCSNLPFGYFNAYGHAAARDDIDLWVHLGDYFYEYKKGDYAPATGAVDGRWPAPEGEILALADYRLRYASYRADPDLQALHAMKPVIASWDDHESTNDSWEGGAENHQEGEGDWSTRKAAAIQAYREWMPVSDEPWATYDVGSLATLFRTETRLIARTEPYEIEKIVAGALGGDVPGALKAFHDKVWLDPAMTMLGSTQEAWLDAAMRASVKSGRKWQVVGFGTIMGETRAPEALMGWMGSDATEARRQQAAVAILAGKLGLPFNLDNWGGYPAARARFLKSAQAMDAELIVLCGDSHNAWAFDLAQDGKPAGVEFAGHSVTSPGFESWVKADARSVARALVETNPELKWCDTSRRGYMTVTLTPDQARSDWWFVDTLLERKPTARIGHSAVVKRGRKVMA